MNPSNITNIQSAQAIPGAGLGGLGDVAIGERTGVVRFGT
jgi:hypothetical protein